MSENEKHNLNNKEKNKKEKLETKDNINVEELLKKKQEEYNQLWEKYLRASADFENIRKRLEREKQEAIKFANEELIIDLLNILDDLERTVSLGQTNQENFGVFLKGVEMVLAHLYELLKSYGVKPIPVDGKPFDPNYHEAILQVENKDLPENTIVEELQKGYLMNDKVIRTAKVKISKKDQSTTENSP